MDFAFLIHSRDYKDVQRKFKIAKFLPRSWVEFWCLHWLPIVVSKIDGLKDKDGKECKGWLIGIPMTAKQMMENRELAKEKIIQAINKAEKLGARIVGLGALTSSVTNGGEEIKDKVNIKVTPGHAYTTYTVSSYVLKAVSEFSLDKNDLTLGIVGAAGSIGSSCAQYLAKKGIKNFILIDQERKNPRLQKLLEKLNAINPDLKISVSHKINDVKNADIVITATNAAEALVKPEDLKYNAIIIDDAQPSDISPEVANERRDVLIIDGGVVATPQINTHFNMGLSSKNDIFCCLGETLIIAHSKILDEYKTGQMDIALVDEFGKRGEALGFKLSSFQRFGKIHLKERIGELKIHPAKIK
jgi:predicted amino acid dehydrogenase